MSRWISAGCRIIAYTAALLATGWACAAIWFDGPANAAISGSIAFGFAAATVALFVTQRSQWRASLAFVVLFSTVLAWWLHIAPSNDRDWLPDVRALPHVEIQGDRVTVHNVRNFDYRSEDDFSEHWETRSYDLADLQGVDLFLSYWGSPWIAHTITSWDFGEGRHLAISIETRKEVGEAYSAVLGFFRQFEIYYVVADERDLVGLRTNYRGETVYRYRMQTGSSLNRSLLLDYFKEINRLAENPGWYNAMTHNCTTTIRRHVHHVAPGGSFDWRILLNGAIDELGYERGTIDNGLPFDEVRKRANITARAIAAGSSADFSSQIRTPRL